MIRKENGKYTVYSEDGSKRLSKPSSKKSAAKRLREIEYFKHRDTNKALESPEVSAHEAGAKKRFSKIRGKLKEISGVLDDLTYADKELKQHSKSKVFKKAYEEEKPGLVNIMAASDTLRTHAKKSHLANRINATTSAYKNGGSPELEKGNDYGFGGCQAEDGLATQMDRGEMARKAAAQHKTDKYPFNQDNRAVQLPGRTEISKSEHGFVLGDYGAWVRKNKQILSHKDG